MEKPDSDQSGKTPGIALGAGFMRGLWTDRGTTGLAIAAGILAALLYVAVHAFLAPGTSTYRQAITLTTTGRDAGTYPNGVRFSVSDLRGGAILREAHASAGLERFGVGLADFDGALTISEFSPAKEQADLRFRDLLAQPGITLEDRRRIENDYRTEIENLGESGALLSLTLRDDQSVPDEVARGALAALLKEWSALHVDRLGIAVAANARDSALLVGESATAGQDVPMAYFAILQAQTLLDRRIARLSALPGFSDIAVGAENRRLKDVAREAEALGLVAIGQTLAPIAFAGVSRDPAMAKLVLNSMVGEERARIAGIRQGIEQIDAIIAQSNAVRPANTAANGDGTVNTQLSDATIARLIDLALGNADLPFRHDLFAEKKQLGEQLRAQTESLERRTAILSAVTTAETAPTPNAQALTARFESTAKDVAANQNRLWGELNALVELTGGETVDNQKQLFISVPIRNAESRNGGLLDRSVWLRALIILATFAAAGLLLQLGRSALKPAE